MGMFDYVHARIKGCPATEFQTKSLECELTDHVIEPSGRLKRYSRRADGWVEMPYTGEIRLLTDVPGGWAYYTALFRKGDLLLVWDDVEDQEVLLDTDLASPLPERPRCWTEEMVEK